ncbi:alpha/beta hydrolase [Nocardioides sp.]|uniref:alpha/beta hydrolase n=1 Tax=Nocardioides sp. TaxID=35761 RepID=UPI003D0B63BA
MSRQTITFRSAGEDIEAFLYLPQGPQSSPPPVVVMAGGWCYVKELVQPIYAEAFAKAGLAVLLFDYRGLGGSTGTPRQHLDPQAQIEDYRNAISYLETREDVDSSRLGAWGISYSGGHVLVLGAIDPRIRAVVSIVPVVDGLPTLKQAHGTIGFRKLTELISDSRRHLYATGEHTYMPHGSATPQEEVVTWPFPSSQPTFAWLKETQGPRYENRATVASTDMLLHYSVYPHVERLIDTPTMMVVAEADDHTMWELEIEAFHKIPTPKKQLEIVPKGGHLGLYKDVDKIAEVATTCGEWFTRWL